MATNFTKVFPRTGAKKASGPLLDSACITADERKLASEVCELQTVRGYSTRGIGALSGAIDQWDASRWSEIDPCEVRLLPDCPCVGEEEVEPLGGCIAGFTPQGWSPGFHDRWCAQVGAGMVGKDYCPGTPRPPVPDCLSPEDQQFVSYCDTYGFNGPNAIYNAFCWGAFRSGVYQDFATRPACQAAPPPSGPPGPPPSGEDEVEEPDEDGKTQRTSMMLPGLILLLVAGGGTAYYFAQRKR